MKLVVEKSGLKLDSYVAEAADQVMRLGLVILVCVGVLGISPAFIPRMDGLFVCTGVCVFALGLPWCIHSRMCIRAYYSHRIGMS